MSAAVTLTLDQARTAVARLFLRHGVSAEAAERLADVIIAAERDGSFSHGFSRLPGYVSTLKSGWIDGGAQPRLFDVAPSLVRVDARNGFCQLATARAQPLLEAKCRETGVGCLTVYNGHHFAALWADVEPWAERGMVALAFVNSRPRITIWNSKKPVLGTNPMAFACPRKDHPPIVWDQASSVRSQGDVLIAARTNLPVAEGIGVDAQGKPTTDANAILSGGALLPFGGYKGGSIAFMVEILVAALGGGNLGFEDDAAKFAGAVTCNTGQTLIVIDPKRASTGLFAGRVEDLIEYLQDGGVERMPGSHRHKRRQEVEASGLTVPGDVIELLERA